MARITVLPPALASQIAAGEVVERPASAAKELIENSLDAGASRCDVVCNGGGVTQLSVSDDGCGMSETDATLSVERHATSKLTQIGDLGHIATFGFRGEALPSIASVSRFVLRSRPKDSEHGCNVEIEAGKPAIVRREGMPVGTTIIVRDLFFNVPARRKFLRSTGTESAHVTSVLEGAALSRPEVTFTLERDGRKLRELLRVRTRRERVQQLLEEESLAEILGERGPLRLEAHLAPPERARAGTVGLWLLVNGRVVRDRMIAATIAQAFGSGIAVGNYPRGVVYVDLPCELVDVNVHPQKTEVRFVDPRALADAIFAIVSRAVSTAFALPSANRAARYDPSRGPGANPGNLLPVEQETMHNRRREPSNPIKADPWALGLAQRGQASRLEQRITEPPLPPASPISSAEADEPAPDTMLTPSLNSPSIEPTRPMVIDEQREVKRSRDPTARQRNRLRYLAQVRLKFIICEGADGLYVIDQHAAAECSTYCKLIAQFAEYSVETQALLFPAMVVVQPRDVQLLEANLDVLRSLGLETQVRGHDQVSIHSIPRLLQRATPERLLRDVLDRLYHKERSGISVAINEAMATMSCHGALRADEVLTAQQAQSLVSDLCELDETNPCPHGRPIISVTRFAELERQAGRNG